MANHQVSSGILRLRFLFARVQSCDSDMAAAALADHPISPIGLEPWGSVVCTVFQFAAGI
jgi:hypothetical protein